MKFRDGTLPLGFVILLLSVSVRAAVPLHEWSQRFGGVGGDFAFGVAVDGAGNVIVAGRFEGTVDFGGGDLTSAGGADIFVAKYDGNGAHQWSQRFGGINFDWCEGMAVDGSDNVILIGYFHQTVDFGGGNVTSAGGTDGFVAKYNSSGAHLWSRGFGGASNDKGYAVTVDGSDDVIVTGSFLGTANFGGGDLTSAGGSDNFVAKYDGNGAHQWSLGFGGPSSDAGYAVAADGSGNLIVSGVMNANYGYARKYDASGVHQWNKSFGVTNFSHCNAVAADGSDNVIVSGYFYDTVNFGGGGITSAGGADFFVAKYDASGAHQWSHGLGGTSGDFGYTAAVDGSGNVIVGGAFEGTADFGGGGITSAGDLDVFVAKYNASGAHQWSMGLGGTSEDVAFAVAANDSGAVIASGYFLGTANFGGGDLTSGGDADLFVAKYTEDETVPVFVTSFAAAPREDVVDITWAFWSDEALDRFTLYRRHGVSPPAAIASGDAAMTRSYTDRSVERGETYHYELVIRTQRGEEFRSQVATVTLTWLEAALYQNFPNPFNPQTTISFTLSEAADVTLAVYDVEGRRVRTLVAGTMEEGEVTWDGRDANGAPVSSGVYFYRLETETRSFTKRMVLLK